MTESNLEGMTVNERLCTLGLMEKFDSAIGERDRETSESVLVEAKYTVAQASETVAAILQHPEKYGY
jgi:hypothetical protein